MRLSVLLLIISFFAITTGFSQVDKIKFEIDGEQYLKIRKNAGGFNIIHQHNSQTSMFFGYNSGLKNIDVLEVYNSGDNNTAYGFGTLKENTTGFFNTALGSRALYSNIAGNGNTAVGANSLHFNELGFNNTCFGQNTLYNNITGGYNIAVGHNSLYYANYAARTVALGPSTGSNDTSSVDNVYVGFFAGRGNPPTDGYDRFNNVMVGSYAGGYCITNGNVFLGFEAGRNAKADNQLYITNSDTDSLNSLIYGQFDNELLRINGDLNIDGLYTLPNTTPTSGQFMKYNGGSNLTWTNIDQVWSFGGGDDALYEDGDVGIGIGNAFYRLDVEDNVSNGYVARFHNGNTSTASKGIIIQAGINTNPTSSTYYAVFLDGNGTNIGGVRGNGGGGTMYSTTSDRRLKQNIRTFDTGLETLNKINPAIYQMKSNPSQDEIGFIAQELQEILPLLVGGNPSDDVEESPMTVDYGRITPVLVAAIKEQQVLIQNQQTLIQELTARLDDQEEKFNQFKAEIIKINEVAE